MTKYVYLFTEGNAGMKNLLGGKGANLSEMTNIGLPVPRGFTVSTDVCTRYYKDGEVIQDDIQKQITNMLAEVISSKISLKKIWFQNSFIPNYYYYN